MVEDLKKMKKKIGIKECQKAVESNRVIKAFVAGDADQKVIKSFIDLCKQNSIEINQVDTMKNLGKACGIEVGASTVVIIKDEI